MRVSRPMATAAVLGLVGALCAVATAQSIAAPGPPQSGVATVECVADEFVVDEILEIGEDAPGGPATALAGLDVYVRRDAPGLAGKAFEHAAEQAHIVQLTRRERGRPIASALVEKVGDSWYVTAFTACETALASGEES